VWLKKITAFGIDQYSLNDDEDEKDSISAISKVMTFFSEISMLIAMAAFLMGMNNSTSSNTEAENKSTDQKIAVQFSNAVPYRVTLSVTDEGGQPKILATYFDEQKEDKKPLANVGDLEEFLRHYPNRKSVLISIETHEALPHMSSVLDTVKLQNQPLVKAREGQGNKKDAEISISVGLPTKKR